MTWDMRTIRPFFEKAAKDWVKKVRYEAVYTMLDSVSTYAPVSSDKFQWKRPESGNLLGNTIVTVGLPTNKTNNVYDPQRYKTLINGLAALKKAKAFDTVYVQNNTEYNIQAEHEGWFFTPAYHYWDKSWNDVKNDVRMMT